MARYLPLLAVQDPPLDDPSPTGPFEPTLRSHLDRFPQARLAVFPELHLCGSHLGTAAEQAEPLDGTRAKWLCRLARDLNIWLIPGTVYELGQDGNFYNTALVIAPSGQIAAAYRKCFPWRPWETVTPGRGFVTADLTGIGRIGISICYDSWFPEVARQLAWMGAEVIIQPTLTATADRPQEIILARAAAIANQVYVVNLNAAAPGGTGHSLIAGPEGEVIYQAGQTPVAMTQVLDLDQVTKARRFGTAGLNRLWDQFRATDHPLPLPAYAGRIDPHDWTPATAGEITPDRTEPGPDAPAGASPAEEAAAAPPEPAPVGGQS